MDRSIQAGVSGFLISVVITVFSPVFLDFIPSFLSAIFAIVIFRLEVLKDGLVTSFMTYLFSQGILNTLAAAIYYMTNEPYTLTIDIWIVLSPIVTSITAIIGGYVGVWLVQRMKPTPSLPPPLPPV